MSVMQKSERKWNLPWDFCEVVSFGTKHELVGPALAAEPRNSVIVNLSSYAVFYLLLNIKKYSLSKDKV